MKGDTPSTKEIESYSNAVDEFEQEREKERILYEAIRPNGSNIVNISSELHDPLNFCKNRFILRDVLDDQILDDDE